MSRRFAVIVLVAARVCVTGLGLGGLFVAPQALGGPAPLFGGPLFAPRRPPPSLDFAYRGWRVHAGMVGRAPRPDKTIRAIKTQIDIVEQLRLDPKLAASWRAMPIYADPSIGRDAGRYTADHRILLRVKRLDAKRPALLHALLLAYQDQRLPAGFGNPEIGRFRQQIAVRHVWPKTAIMLENNGEFFAVTASAYLYGEITREPYTRADLKKTQPDYYRWLANLFDGGRPRA